MIITREPKVPGTNSQLLSDTEKMPCKSWSLPAGDSCPDAEYGPGMVCQGCYAKKGRYRGKTVQTAQHRRFRWTVGLMKSAAGRAEWVEYMTAAITWATRNKEPIFRVHDSGDLFSVHYVASWIKVCQNLPHVTFWFPTRVWDHGQAGMNPLKLAAVLKLSSLPNTTVRPSGIGLDDAPPVVDGYAAGTGVAEHGYTCPARNQGGKCLTCRACWYSPHAVIYHLITERGRPRSRKVIPLTLVAA
jgi:hypothetical protein